MTGALGGDVRYELRKTVNPLVYKITFYFPDALTGQQMLLVWNLLQQYAAKNEAIPQGKVEKEGARLTASVIIRRRLGLPKAEHPVE